MMRISLILGAVNRLTAPMEAAVRSVRQLGATAASESRRVSASMVTMYDTTRDAAHHFRTLAGEEGMSRAARSAEYLKRQVSGLTGGLSILKYASIGAGIGLGEEFIRGVFRAGGEMQQMLVTLTRLEGSATRARAAMSWMQTFAMGPGASFKMPDIMRSYQMAKNFGMDPQRGSLAAFADLAAGERVPMKQVLYAVKDAMEGTSTRPISNLGIKMRQGHGADGVDTYTYANLAGKWVTETSSKAPDAVLATLVRIINSKYAGLATQQAKTVPGGIAQLHQLLYQFEGKVAGAGVFDWALKQMNRFFVWVRQASASGELDKLASRISKFMTGTGDKIIDFVKSTDWAAVGRDLSLLGGALLLVAKGVALIAKLGGGGLHGLFNLWLLSKIIGITRALFGFSGVARAAFTMLSPFILRFGSMLLGLVVAGGPITLVIAAVAALAGGAYLIYRNWSGISAFFSRIWASITGSVPKPEQLVPRVPGAPRVAGLPQGQGALSVLFNPFTGLTARGAPRAGPARPAPVRPGTAPASWQAPRGKLTIELVGPGATDAKMKHLQATGMDVDVKRGPIGVGG